MEQAIIAVTGGLAFCLTQQSNQKLKRYACLVGLIGQPFWMYATYTNELPGMFIATLIHTFGCLLGIKNNWIKKKQRIVYSSGDLLPGIIWRR
jgi:hypothetical protein